jgi:hypothetical protein
LLLLLLQSLLNQFIRKLSQHNDLFGRVLILNDKHGFSDGLDLIFLGLFVIFNQSPLTVGLDIAVGLVLPETSSLKLG